MRGDARERGLRVPTDCLQLLENAQQHVVLADAPEPIGDLAQPSVEPAGDVRVELEHGQDLAEPAGGHPRTAQRLDVPVFNPLEHPCKSVEAAAQQVVTRRTGC